MTQVQGRRDDRAAPPARVHYGYDAPGIMLSFLLGGGAVVLLGYLLSAFASVTWRYVGAACAIVGPVPLFFGLLMVAYAFAGKVRTREHILNLAALRGDESVLDVGTGAGLLLVGAAKRTPRGEVVGIALWASKDLSDNAAAMTMGNAVAEGVAYRVEIVTGDARQLPFADASFDRVVSLLCIHNIENKADQARLRGDRTRSAAGRAGGHRRLCPDTRLRRRIRRGGSNDRSIQAGFRRSALAHVDHRCGEICRRADVIRAAAHLHRTRPERQAPDWDHPYSVRAERSRST